MARYTGPKHKLCRAEGLALCGLPTCPVIKKNAGPPGEHSQKGRRKPSEYGIQLREKQKVKRIYGVLERQFKKYYQKATQKKGSTGETLLELLESRLDNVVYRLHFTRTRTQARQLVSHGHIFVNSKRVNIPSYNVKIGDVISLSAKAANFIFIKKSLEEAKDSSLLSWLKKEGAAAKVTEKPKREEIDLPIDERLIVEFYSR